MVLRLIIADDWAGFLQYLRDKIWQGEIIMALIPATKKYFHRSSESTRLIVSLT